MLVVISPRVPLPDGVVLRLLAPHDARALAAAYARNAEHLAPWEPARADDLATECVQAVRVENLLAGVQKGSALPLVLVRPAPGASADDEIVGTLTVSGITRGAFESADLGYWTDRGLQGRGIMSAAVSAVVGIGAGRPRAAPAPGGHAAGERTLAAGPGPRGLRAARSGARLPAHRGPLVRPRPAPARPPRLTRGYRLDDDGAADVAARPASSRATGTRKGEHDT